jgi:putative transposase
MPRPLRPIAEGLAYHVGKSPVIQNDDHLLTVLRYIEANPLRAGIVDDAGADRWSSFGGRSAGRADALLSPIPAYESLGAGAAVRRRRWSAYVHQRPDDAELAALRRSNVTGLPFGTRSWINRLSRRLKLDLTIRPRGRPRQDTKRKEIVLTSLSIPFLPIADKARR